MTPWEHFVLLQSVCTVAASEREMTGSLCTLTSCPAKISGFGSNHFQITISEFVRDHYLIDTKLIGSMDMWRRTEVLFVTADFWTMKRSCPRPLWGGDM